MNPPVFGQRGRLSKTLVTLRALERLFTGVNPLVLHQVRPLDETLVTLCTMVWANPRVGSKMLHQIGCLEEALGTSVAQVLSFCVAGSEMFLEAGFVGEGFGAFRALVQKAFLLSGVRFNGVREDNLMEGSSGRRGLCRVDLEVLDQIQTLFEGSFTMRTVVRPLPSVRSAMFGQRRAFREPFITFGAVIRLLTTVNSLVFDQVRVLDEAFPALVTGIWFLPHVSPHVLV